MGRVRSPRRMLAVVAAAALAGSMLILSSPIAVAAGPAADPLNTGVTANPLKYACEDNAASCNHVGTTNGWFNGEDVKFLYTQDFYCDETVKSGAATGCEAGASYKQLPPGTAAGAIDPLYIPVALFKNPTPSYVQCQASPMCIDHPATVDLSALSSVLGAPASALKNAMLPGHDHIVATRNGDAPEWWPVVVVGVADQASWTAITTGKSYAALKAAEKASPKTVLEVPTNVFLWFQTLPGHVSTAEAGTNSTAVPPASTNGAAIDNLKNDCTTAAASCGFVGQTRAWLGDAGTAQGSDVNLLYSAPYFCDSSVQKAGANACEAGAAAAKVPPDITSTKYTDPLYIPTPLFKQAVPDLQCATGLNCIDHPMTADLSRLATTLGVSAAALANFTLPGHDHIITTRNGDAPEWWPVTVVGVTNPQSFALIEQARSYAEVKKLEADPKNGVLEVPTNIYLFFQSVPGTGKSTAAFNPIPVGPPQTGGGSTAGLQYPALVVVGFALLLGAGAAGTAGVRRRRNGKIAA